MRYFFFGFAAATACCGLLFHDNDVLAQGARRPGKTPIQSTCDLSAYQSDKNGTGLFLPPIDEISPRFDTNPWVCKPTSRTTVNVSSLKIGGDQDINKCQSPCEISKSRIPSVVRKQGAPHQRITPSTSLAAVFLWIMPTQPWSIGLTAGCIPCSMGGFLFYVLQRRRRMPPVPKNLAAGLVGTQVRRKKLAIPVVMEQTTPRRRAA